MNVFGKINLEFIKINDIKFQKEDKSKQKLSELKVMNATGGGIIDYCLISLPHKTTEDKDKDKDEG